MEIKIYHAEFRDSQEFLRQTHRIYPPAYNLLRSVSEYSIQLPNGTKLLQKTDAENLPRAGLEGFGKLFYVSTLICEIPAAAWDCGRLKCISRLWDCQNLPHLTF